jgi:excinuclease ABC subunit B
MRKTIEETERRRAMQIAYNEAHGLTPTALNKSKEKIMQSTKVADGDPNVRAPKEYTISETTAIAADVQMSYKNPAELDHAIATKRKQMEKAAKDLDFIQAAKYRDELFELQAKKK